MRTRGLSMLGTELEPDYGIYAGEFQDDSDRNTRFAAIGKPLGPTSAEEALWRASAPDPDERYHYRARAADLADQAAGELADDDPRVPILLCRAARWQGDPRISRKYTHEAIMRTGAWPSEPCGDPSFAPLRVLLKRIAAVALGAFLLGILRWRRRPTTERSA